MRQRVMGHGGKAELPGKRLSERDRIGGEHGVQRIGASGDSEQQAGGGDYVLQARVTG